GHRQPHAGGLPHALDVAEQRGRVDVHVPVELGVARCGPRRGGELAPARQLTGHRPTSTVTRSVFGVTTPWRLGYAGPPGGPVSRADGVTAARRARGPRRSAYGAGRTIGPRYGPAADSAGYGPADQTGPAVGGRRGYRGRPDRRAAPPAERRLRGPG